MSYMTTPTELLAQLAAQGYDTNLWIADDGTITSGSASWPVELVEVRDISRFEGRSDPGDETIIVAIGLGGRPLGAITLPYGADMSAAQAETIRRLQRLPGTDPTG